MTQITNFELVVTEDDRIAAREAIIEAWNNCKQTNSIGNRQPRSLCDCDLGAIDGCKAKIESVARAIAFARKH
jgi:hypothetical protein